MGAVVSCYVVVTAKSRGISIYVITVYNVQVFPVILMTNVY